MIKKTSLLEAFNVADDVLRQGVQGIAEIITVPGIINADFADVKAVMSNAGSALMGIGQASGENKAIEAAKGAINSSLLDMSIDGARGIVFTITGGPDLSMNEVSEAAKVITAAADEEAKIIFGAVIDENLITVVATGFDGQGSSLSAASRMEAPKPSALASNNFEEDLQETPKQNKWMEKAKPKLSAFKNTPLKPVIERKMDQPAETNKEDDDLSVPAFIRKKML